MRPALKPGPRPTARDAIIDAAIRLWSRNPGATFSEVALQAGVGRATLHRHFRNRHELLTVLAEICIEETNEAVAATLDEGASARRQLQGMFKAVIPLGDRYSFLYRVDIGDEHTTAEYRRQLEQVAALVGRLKSEGAVAADVPTAWVVAQIDQLVWTAWNEVAAGRIAAADAANLAARTLLHGLGKEEQP